MEGAFIWHGPPQEEKDHTYASPNRRTTLPEHLTHIFLSSSIQVPLRPDTSRSSSNFRASIKDTLKRTFFRNSKPPPSNPAKFGRRRRASDPEKPSAYDANSSHAFSFPLPSVEGKLIPSSFSVSHISQGTYRERWYSERAEIQYKIIVKLRPRGRGREKGGKAGNTFEDVCVVLPYYS